MEIINDKYIFFGSFPQTNENTKEPIKWRIIKNEDNILTLITDSILYNNDFDYTSSNYKTSKIRKYILEEFIPFAFTKQEQKLILKTQLDDIDEKIIDKVYLPSYDDLKNFTKEELMRKVTPYARNNKTSMYTLKDKVLNGNGWYWTRTPYKPDWYKNHVYYVTYFGDILERTGSGRDIGIVLMTKIKID